MAPASWRVSRKLINGWGEVGREGEERACAGGTRELGPQLLYHTSDRNLIDHDHNEHENITYRDRKRPSMCSPLPWPCKEAGVDPPEPATSSTGSGRQGCLVW